MTHYKLDRADARRWTGRDKEREQQDAREDGWYSYHTLEIVPLRQITHQGVWKPSRIERIREAIQNGTPLPAIHATKGPDGKYQITDGIHRYNASVEAGFTHIPVIDTVVVETPDQKVEPEPERAQLPVGAWVKLRKPGHGESEWAMVEEHLTWKMWKGARRHMYGLVGVRNHEGDFIGDHMDIDFDPATALPPADIQQAVRDWYGWRGEPPAGLVARVAARWRAGS